MGGVVLTLEGALDCLKVVLVSELRAEDLDFSEDVRGGKAGDVAVVGVFSVS